MGAGEAATRPARATIAKENFIFAEFFVVGIGIKIICGFDLAVRTVVGLFWKNEFCLKSDWRWRETRETSFPPFSTKSGDDQRIYSPINQHSITQTVPSTSSITRM